MTTHHMNRPCGREIDEVLAALSSLRRLIEDLPEDKRKAFLTKWEHYGAAPINLSALLALEETLADLPGMLAADEDD